MTDIFYNNKKVDLIIITMEEKGLIGLEIFLEGETDRHYLGYFREEP